LIRITKPAIVPEKLQVEGKKKRRAHSQAFTRNPDTYSTGSAKFAFDDGIYAHKTVKEALISAQHKKCCFCERLIGSDGDVEHFRPKQAYRQKAGEKLQYPGYYWLAYEWDNLYLSCAPCNQRHKKNLFPLVNPAERAANHKQSITQEQPLLIDPGKENPEDFISFRGEMPFSINDNSKGVATIKFLKLGERALPDARLQQLQKLRALHRIVLKATADPKNSDIQKLAREAQQVLDDAVQDTSEFAAANRAAIKDQFRYVKG
jgi:uncharacterized protein (TIGR02646 family)